MLAHLLTQHARSAPERPAIIDADGTLGYGALLAAAYAFAAWLAHEADVPSYALVLPQRAAGICALLACDLLGRDVLVIAESRGLPSARRHAHALGLHALVYWRDSVAVLERIEAATTSRSVDAAEPSILLLTSGTSGTPKCARHCYRTLAAAVKTRSRMFGQRWLLGYPVAQFAGLQVALQSLSNGGTLVIPRSFSPAHCLDALLVHEVHYLTCTPTAARLMLVGSGAELVGTRVLEHVTLGGECADQAIIDALRGAFPAARVTCTYASTELGLLLSASDGLAGFACAAIDGVQLRIVDGELESQSSERAMLGYLSQPAERASGWSKTGDLAELRGDRVFVLGRADDLINVGGFKVAPSVVEETLRTARGVLEAVVTGQKNSVLGQLVKARVRLADGVDPQEGKASILAHCREHLPYYMVPRLLEVVEHLELNVSQKLVRS